MKIRSDFVSNSSSSSFIFYAAEFFRTCNVTKEKLLDALIDLYGESQYKEYYKHVGHYPIEVFDLHDEDDLKAAKSMYSDLLSEWDQCLPKDEDYIGSPYRNSKNYQSFIEIINDVYDTHLSQGTDEDLEYARIYSPTWCRFEHWLRYHKVLKFFLGWFAEKMSARPLSRQLKGVIRDVRSSLGIMTNAELLDDPDTRFFIHMDDNAIWEIKGTEVDKLDENDTTKSYSYLRFMKLLFRKICTQNGLFDDGHDTINLIIRNPDTNKLEVIDDYGPEDFMKEVTATYNTHEG